MSCEADPPSIRFLHPLFRELVSNNGCKNLISGLQPLDANPFFDHFKLRVPGQDPPFMALGQGRAEGVGVGDGVLGLDFGGFADERIIHLPGEIAQ